MKTNSYLVVSALVFALVALVHLFRLVEGWPVLLGTLSVPLWGSIIAILVSGALAVWGFLSVRRMV